MLEMTTSTTVPTPDPTALSVGTLITQSEVVMVMLLIKNGCDKEEEHHGN